MKQSYFDVTCNFFQKRLLPFSRPGAEDNPHLPQPGGQGVHASRDRAQAPGHRRLRQDPHHQGRPVHSAVRHAGRGAEGGDEAREAAHTGAAATHQTQPGTRAARRTGHRPAAHRPRHQHKRRHKQEHHAGR